MIKNVHVVCYSGGKLNLSCFRLSSRRPGHSRSGECGGANDDSKAAGSGAHAAPPVNVASSCDGAIVDDGSEGAMQPLALLPEDACRGGECRRISADRIRCGDCDSFSCAESVSRLAQLPVNQIRAHVGGTHDGRMLIFIILRGVASRMGSRQLQTSSDAHRVNFAQSNYHGFSASYSDVSGATGHRQQSSSEGGSGAVHRERCNSNTTRRHAGHALLRGPTISTGFASRSVPHACEEACAQVHRPGVPNVGASGGVSPGGVSLGVITQRPSGRLARAEFDSSRKRQKVDICALQSRLNDAQRQLRQKEVDREQKVRMEMRFEMSQLEAELTTFKISDTNLRKKLRYSKEEASSLRIRAAEEEKAKKEALAMIAGLQQTIASLQADSQKSCVTLRQTEQALRCERDEGVAQARKADRAEEKMQALKTKLKGCDQRHFNRLEQKVEAAQDRLSTATAEVKRLTMKSENQVSTIHRLAGSLGGRKPIMGRTDSELESLPLHTALQWRTDAHQRISEAIGVVDSPSEMPLSTIMQSLKEGGYLPRLWESQEMWEFRIQWAGELSEMLRMVWDAKLTLRLKDKLSVSQDKLDELRYALSHYRVGKQLRPRPWVICPHTGMRVNFPQPIVARTRWCPLVKTFIEQHGLVRDAAGLIAQRSYKVTVTEQVLRDIRRGWIPPDSKLLRPTLGADGTVVGKVGFMHVSSDVSANYLLGISQQNEQNLCTIAAAQTDDHWGGLNKVLCKGFYTSDARLMPDDCIAAEFNTIIASGKLEVNGVQIPAAPTGCFDLAAARGIRGGHGRCACHCACLTCVERHSVPQCLACDETADVSWTAVQQELESHQLLEHGTMMNDSHTPPDDWDWSKLWECTRSGCAVKFDNFDAYLKARNSFFLATKDISPAAKKATAARAAHHLKLHPSNQGEFNPPLTKLQMRSIILDPLHALLLNLPKTIWKYAFGDRMTNMQRELVAEYLLSIGCPLDVRAKTDGRDANRKWFLGEAFQRFGEGEGGKNQG